MPDLVFCGALVKGMWLCSQTGHRLDAAGTQIAMYYSLANADETVVLLLAKGCSPCVACLCLSKGSGSE